MRIISPFKDVYDLQHSMFDESRIWTRRTEEVLIKRDLAQPMLRRDNNSYFRATNTGTYVDYFPVFIAGKVTYVYAFYNKEREWVGSASKKDSVVALAEKLGLTSLSSGYSFEKPERLEKEFDARATKEQELIQLATNLFLDLRTPLAYISKLGNTVPDDASSQPVSCYTVVTNPRLMGSIIPWQEIDPNLYRLHQELDQYLWGVLGTGEPDMLTTSDKDRLIAHGFDVTTSFRNMKRN